MRDPVFSGPDVPGALAIAAEALGQPVATLRYVTLDPGRPAGRGLQPQPARIAILGAGPAPSTEEPLPPPPPARTPGGAVGRILGALAEAVGAPLEAERIEEDGLLRLQLRGEATRVFLNDDGEALEALGLLLQRIESARDPELRVEVRCEAFRERRDAQLREKAQTLARAVVEDGVPRRMSALNAYDRRIVHMAVAEVPGARSASEGEGRERRLVIARAGAEPHA